jgi:aerobic C4-dicarboxylate transport protein
MSEGRAITNFIGNTVATIVIAKSENAIDEVIYKKVVEGRNEQVLQPVEVLTISK